MTNIVCRQIHRNRKQIRGYQGQVEGGIKSYSLMGTVSVWDDEIILEIDG